jgi:hypothetical protein
MKNELAEVIKDKLLKAYVGSAIELIEDEVQRIGFSCEHEEIRMKKTRATINNDEHVDLVGQLARRIAEYVNTQRDKENES